MENEKEAIKEKKRALERKLDELESKFGQNQDISELRQAVKDAKSLNVLVDIETMIEELEKQLQQASVSNKNSNQSSKKNSRGR